MEQMRLQTKVILSYSVVYPDRHDKIEDLLDTVPSNSAIEFVATLISWKNRQLITQKEYEVWFPWVLQCRDEVKNPIGQYMAGEDGNKYEFIDRYALLSLLDKILCCYNNGSDELNEDDKSNLLLAYLICCDERLEYGKKLPDNTMSAEEFVRRFLPIELRTNDVEATKDYRLQLIKCYSLLIEFPKVNERFAGYVKAFCEDLGLKDAKEYLDQLFMMNFDLMGAQQGTAVMEIDKGCEQSIRFIERFTLDVRSYKHTGNFNAFSEFPVLKTGPNRFVFLSIKQFLDKAFTGLMFDMADALGRRGVFKQKNAYPDLKGFVGEEFSERYLFYMLMERCFGKEYVKYRGTELNSLVGKGEPDYYMRKGNRIFVFECKDAILANRYKLSGDYDQVIKGVEEKFVSNDKSEPKGITQLANTIESKLPRILGDVDKAAPKSVMYIFPILVYFDSSFDPEGVNWHLNGRFKELMSVKRISPDYVVKDLMMINIEQLMRLENFFADGKLKLAAVINDYIDYKERSELNQVFPFNKFIFQEARKKGYEMRKSRWFDNVYESLKTMDKKEEFL